MCETKTVFEFLVLVDSDQEILHTFRRFLERQGYAVATASQGPEAMHQLRLRRPDLVVIEPMMSEDWGERFLEQCQYTVPKVPVIGVSKSSMCITQFQFCAYLVKPISLFGLLETIRSCLQPSAWAHP